MFVYHALPPGMQGDTLHPLADLETLAPELYTCERSKYDDHPARRRIPQALVAKLGCARRETFNLVPVHPHFIFWAWADLGVVLPPKGWFRIPVVRFVGLPAVVFTPHGGVVGADIADADVAWFGAGAYRELTELPPATLEEYTNLRKAGKYGAWFAGVPHVLVRGAVSVAGLEPFDWSVPNALVKLFWCSSSPALKRACPLPAGAV